MGFSFIYYANSPRDRICSLEIQLGMVGFLESEKPQINIFWLLSKLPLSNLEYRVLQLQEQILYIHYVQAILNDHDDGMVFISLILFCSSVYDQ